MYHGIIDNQLPNTTYGRSFQSTTIQHNNKNDKLLSTNSNSRRINSQKTLLRSNQKKYYNSKRPMQTIQSVQCQAMQMRTITLNLIMA